MQGRGKSPHGTALRTISVTGGVTETVTGQVRCCHSIQGKANTYKHWLIWTPANPKAIHAWSHRQQGVTFCYLLENKFHVMTAKSPEKEKSFRNLLLNEVIGIVELWLLLLLPGLKKPPPEESHIPLKHIPQASSSPISLTEELVPIQETRGSWMEKSEHFLGPSEQHWEPELSYGNTHTSPFTAQQAQSWGQWPRGEGNIKAQNTARAKKS